MAPKSISSEGVFDRYDLFAEVGASIELTDLAELARQELVDLHARNCLIVLNTVQEALDLFALLNVSWAGGYRRFHLSTNLRPKDRGVILASIAANAEGALVVSTQVVETGLDISFDIVLRALAPVDSIVQAAGRANRHGAGPRGKVRVVQIAGNSGNKVYGPVHMDVAGSVFGEIDGRRVAEPELRRYVSQYFERLKEGISRNRARDILEAVQMMEFASLRGDGYLRNSEKKQVTLIEDETSRIAHFVETDESDLSVWKRFQIALDEPDRWKRRRALRAARNELGQRIVDVPKKWAAGEPDPKTGLVYVKSAAAAELYSTETGWRRIQ